MEPTLEDIEEEKNLHFGAKPDAHTTNSITTQWMMAEQVKLDTLSHHAINSNQVLKLSLKHYWRNMHLNFHKMKPPSEQHL